MFAFRWRVAIVAPAFVLGSVACAKARDVPPPAASQPPAVDPVPVPPAPLPSSAISPPADSPALSVDPPAASAPEAERQAGPVLSTACNTDADCRKFSETCRTCICRPLARSSPDPKCTGHRASCLIDPCQTQRAICRKGNCALVSDTAGPDR